MAYSHDVFTRDYRERRERLERKRNREGKSRQRLWRLKRDQIDTRLTLGETGGRLEREPKERDYREKLKRERLERDYRPERDQQEIRYGAMVA